MKCEYCGKELPPDMKMRGDPYDEEINDDFTKHWICDDCYNKCVADI